MKHTKEIDGNAVIRKRAVEIINEATANGLEREEIREHLCNAWKRVFNEECLGLDTNTGEEGLGLDTNTDEEDPDLTGGFVNGVAGSADALQEDSEKNLRTQIEEAATNLNMPLFNSLQLHLNDLRGKKASGPTPPPDALPTTSLPRVPLSIPQQAALRTPSPPLKTPSPSSRIVPLHPVIPPIPPFTTAIPLRPQIDPKIIECIKDGAEKMRLLEADNKKMKAELAENQKKKGLLSEKDKTKAMIDNAASKASEKATSTSNKRGGRRGKQLTKVSAIDNCQAAPPSGIDIVYEKGVLFYYCSKCNAYGLCKKCHDEKQKAEELNESEPNKRRRGREKRMGVVKDTDVCDHSTVELKSQQDRRYLPRYRKAGMTGTYTTCYRCARNL